jgi:hypothetical protein
MPKTTKMCHLSSHTEAKKCSKMTPLYHRFGITFFYSAASPNQAPFAHSNPVSRIRVVEARKP